MLLRTAGRASPGRHTDRRGFTLIEILVVLALIALIALMAVPNISSYFQISLNSAARQLSTTIKEAYDSTVLTGRVYRIVYDLKNNAYWVESGPATVLLDTEASKEKAERRKRFLKPGEEAPASPFAMDKSVTRSKVSLPRGVVFEDILTQKSKEPITEGTCYTHFFPHGITEQTLIHLTDSSKHHASLVVSALVGKTDLYDRYLSKEDAFGKH